MLTLLLLCSRPPRAPQALQLTMQAVQLKMQGEAARQASGGPAIDEDVVKGAIMEAMKGTMQTMGHDIQVDEKFDALLEQQHEMLMLEKQALEMQGESHWATVGPRAVYTAGVV